MKVALLAKWPAAIGLFIGTILLTRSAQTTFAADKPVHSAIVTLGVCGVVLLIASRILPRDVQNGEGKGDYEAVPLRDVQRRSSEGEEEGVLVEEGSTHSPSSLRRLRICFVVLVLALCIRAEILHRVLKHVQCSTRSWTPLIPLAFAVEEWWRVRRRRGQGGDAANDDEDASAYEALARLIAAMPGSRVISVGMVVFGGMLALGATSAPRSTYICAATLPYRLQIPHFQALGMVLDVIVVWCVGQLITLQHGQASRSLATRAAAVGWALVISSTIVLVIGIIYYFAEEADRVWILQIPRHFVWSLLRLDMYAAFALLCALALISHVGVLTTSLLATLTSVLTITTVSAWNNAHPFPSTHLGSGIIAISTAMLGFTAYSHLETTSKHHHSPLFPRGIPFWTHLIFITIFLIWTTLFFATSTSVNYHPIDMLMYQASARHEAFLAQAWTSRTLTRAVQVYKHRYNRHPPPDFDRWHQFAMERDSVIIDDFDSIYNDLLPFYALEPHVIRERTWDLISNPWNDVAGLSIRDGKVNIMDNGIPGTHAWMLDGLVEMIGKFAEWLPDMDLAFNLNDECRVAVSYEDIQALRFTASSKLSGAIDTPPQQTTFSPSRAETWKPLIEDRNTETPLHETSWQKTFHTHSAQTCPLSSPARTLRTWDTSSLCTACQYPHSLGAFLSNWTLAADICPQPDLADLHGIYLSPAAFKATQELYPFFSQSRVGGFNDILYPSAWNYMEKAHYGPSEEFPDVEWEAKKDVLFWRGATSEGVSQGWGQWKGMVRQRFVNMFSSNSTTAPTNIALMPVGDPVPPNTTDSNGKAVHNKLAYTNLNPNTIGVTADVHVVENIVRCAGPDCSDQAAALAPLVPPIDFQSHWQNKYLLDLDGAGFSGRFLPFLRSKSLPIKAGLFREWWDGRVTAWKHFIPVDVRGTGAWGVLQWLEGHGKEGERVAMEGREWAGRVLRSEDMEIYMFRLLLEWGRMTDDRRDEFLGTGAR